MIHRKINNNNYNKISFSDLMKIKFNKNVKFFYYDIFKNLLYRKILLIF